MKTRKGVEIIRAGKFNLSTGPFDFTRERLARAVAKAVGGAAARIGIGHRDERFAASDGEPALGRIENLTLAEDGNLIVGDLVDMPDWFADALPSAFPGRSIEGRCDGDDLTITGLKMLGTTMPGIHTLADLRQFVSDEGPVALAAGADNDGNDFTVVLASGEREDSGVSLEDARAAFGVINKYVAASAETPNQEVSVMDPKEIREALGLPEDATNEQVSAKIKDLREASEKAEAAERKAKEDADAKAEQDAKAKADAETKEAETPVAASGQVLIDEQQLAELKASAAKADELHAAEQKRTRDGLLDKAQQEGRFPLSRREHYSNLYDADPEGTTTLLAASAADGGLAPGLVPVAKAEQVAAAEKRSEEDELVTANVRRLRPNAVKKGA